MRRLTLLVASILLASGCLSSTIAGLHWSGLTGTYAAGTQEQVVWLMTAPDATNYWLDVDVLSRAAYVWSVSSPYVEVRVRSGDWCQSYPWEDCAQVYLGTVTTSYGWSAYTRRGVTPDGHIVSGQYTYVQFDFGVLWDSDREFWYHVGCHEVGHVLGLEHGDDGDYGPCAGRWPTQTDLDNVARLYAHGDVRL